MTPLKRNLSRLLILFIILILGAATFGIVYFFKMERNEDTLNVLYFRELQQIEGTIQRSLEKVQATAEYSLSGSVSSDRLADVQFERREKAIKKQSKNNFDTLSNAAPELSDIHVLDFTVRHWHENPDIPSFSFSIPQFNTVTFTQTSYQKDSRLVETLTLQSSISGVLQQRLNRLQTLALVAHDGDVKSVANNAKMLVNEPEFFFRQVMSVVDTGAGLKGNSVSDVTAGISLFGTRFSDVKLNNSTYRVYVHPLTSRGFSADGKNFYLIGVVNKRQITAQKLRLSPELLMWVILSLLLLIAITPLLKLRFISATYAIQRGDKSQIVLGLIIAVGIITIGLSQQFFFSYLTDVKAQQLKQLHSNIKQDFAKELTTLLRRVETVSKAQLPDDSCSNKKATKCRNTTERLPFTIHNELLVAETNARLFLEAIAGLGSHGGVVSSIDKPAIYVGDSVKYNQDMELSDREYFKAGMAKKYWSYPVGGKHVNVYLQRVFNIEDGRRNLILALDPSINDDLTIKAASCKKESDNNNNGEDSDEHCAPTLILLASARLSALVDRVLPNNFGYAVIDDTGKVLFHSDDSLSLVENFFIEIGQAPQLILASRHANISPIPIEVEYKGDPHTMAIGPLVDPQSERSIPWKLVVFFNPNEVQTNNMVLVFTAVFLFLLFILPGFILLRYVTVQRFWQEVCFYDPIRRPLYWVLAFFLFACASSVSLQMGWVHSLTGRLLVWMSLCTLVIGLLCYVWGQRLRLTVFCWWRHPCVAGVFPLVLLMYEVLRFPQAHPESVGINIFAAVIGVLLVVCTSAPVLRKIRTIQTENSLAAEEKRRKIEIAKGHERHRFSRGYVGYLSGLIFMAAVVPAAVIAYSAHEYLLQRQAQFEQADITKQIIDKQEAFNRYIAFINGGACSDAHSFPCNITLNPGYEALLGRFFPEKYYCNKAEQQDCYTGIPADMVLFNSRNFPGVFCDPDKPVCDFQWAWFDEENSSTVMTDSMFNTLYASILGQSPFVSHLSYAAKQDSQDTPTTKTNRKLIYRADLFMTSAMFTPNGKIVLIVMLFLLPMGVYLTSRQLIVRRLLGEHLIDQYRIRSGCLGKAYYATEFPNLNEEEKRPRGYSHLILNTTRLRAEQELLKTSPDQRGGSNRLVLFGNKILRVVDCLDKYYDLDEHADAFYFINRVEAALAENRSARLVVALSALEQLSLNAEARKDALDLLYELHLHQDVILVLVAETAPLYRLLNPAAYESASALTTEIDEKSGWTKLFSEFDKYYAWSPACKFRISNPFDVEELIKHECHAWPEIEHLRDKFGYREYWEPEQVIEFMLVHAGPLYRRKWEECTVNEKVTLWRMAHGASINPQSSVTIERLVRRCYLYRDKGWHLINESFRQFVLTAEADTVMKDWMDKTSVGAWSVLRIPIFAVLLVLLAVFVYSSGSSLNTLLSLATATLGLIPLLIRNLNLLRGGSNTDIE